MTIRLEEHLALQVNHGNIDASTGAHSTGTTDIIYFGDHQDLADYLHREMKLIKEGTTDHPLLNYQYLIKTVVFENGARFGEHIERGNTYIIGKLVEKCDIPDAFALNHQEKVDTFMTLHRLRSIVKLADGSPYMVMHTAANSKRPYYFPKDAILVDTDDRSHQSSYRINDKVGTQVFDTKEMPLHIGSYYPYVHEVPDQLVSHRTNYVVRMQFSTFSGPSKDFFTKESMHTNPWTAQGEVLNTLKQSEKDGAILPHTIDIYKAPVIILPAGVLTLPKEVIASELIPERTYRIGQIISRGQEIITTRGAEPICASTLVLNRKHCEGLRNPADFNKWLGDLRLRLKGASWENIHG